MQDRQERQELTPSLVQPAVTRRLEGEMLWTDLVVAEEEPGVDSGIFWSRVWALIRAPLVCSSQVSSVKWGEQLSDALIPTHSHIQMTLAESSLSSVRCWEAD